MWAACGCRLNWVIGCYRMKKNEKENVHSVSSLSAVLLIIAAVLLFDIVLKIDNSTPAPLKIADEKNYPDRFIAERAQNHLRQLTSIGPKVTGSYENEVLAVDFLKREINFIIQQSNRKQKIELDHQRVSGSYFLNYKPYGLVNVYDNVQNVIARISSAGSSNHSLLVNCHFDSVPTSPGASDDGINCVAMLEVLRVLSKQSTRPVHNIVFLFNGAEENPLQAAHGFIAKHKWAKEIRAVINLEAAGLGGKEILFQAGPGNRFLLEAYTNNAPHPHGHSAAEEIFHLNLIPSDTDFRIFRDFGHVPGLDFAFARNGYVYHTKHDSFEKIDLGSYQHVGDNLLAVVKALASSADLPTATLDSKEKSVYFDILFGLHIFMYSEQTAIVINTITIIISVLMFIKLLYDLRQSSLLEVIVNIFFSGIGQMVSIVLSFFVVILIAFILDQFNLTMSWYTRPKIIFGLYICPILLFLSIPVIIENYVIENISLSLGTRTQIHAHTSRMTWTFLLTVTTYFAIRISYIFLIPVLFNTISFIMISFLNLYYTRRTWLYVYLISLIIPTIVAMNMTALLFDIFIPILGRFGSNKNPDDFVGVLSVFGSLLIASGFIPLITLVKKPSTVIAGLLMTFFITLTCIAFTNYGFPYGDDASAPSPERFWIYHTNRVFHDATGNVRKQDSGYFLLNMDRNSPKSVEKFVPELKEAISIQTDCEQAVYCGLPIYISRMLTFHEDSTWIPAPPAVIHEPVTLKLMSKNKVSFTKVRYSFKSSGPDHYTIFLSPKPNITVTKWSFTPEIPEVTYQWHGRPTYFIMYGYGEQTDHWNFWIEMETPEHWTNPVMDIAISGKYTHHEKTQTEKYTEFLNQFPSWTHLTAWMANYHSWIY
ncbi:uncharacterized protein CBL_03903 [Carabus blaptoides fortunei]